MNTLNMLNICKVNLLSLLTVGLLAGAILSESFGPAIGWTAGLAMAVLGATAAYEAKRAGMTGWRIEAALLCLTVGLASGRIIHGVHDVQVDRERVAREANAERAACLATSVAKRDSKVNNYQGRWITRNVNVADARLAEDEARCRELYPVAKAEVATLRSLTSVELFRIFGPIWLELFAALAVKVYAAALVASLRKREEQLGEAQAAEQLEEELELLAAKANGAEAKLQELKEEREAGEWRIGARGGEYRLVNGRKVYRRRKQLEPTANPSPTPSGPAKLELIS